MSPYQTKVRVFIGPICLLLVFVLGCGRRSEHNEFKWSAHRASEGKVPGEILTQIREPAKISRIGALTVEKSSLRIGEVTYPEISFVVTKNSSGQRTSIVGPDITLWSPETFEKMNKLEILRTKNFATIASGIPVLKAASEVFPPKIRIVETQKGRVPVLLVPFLPHSRDGVFELGLNENGNEVLLRKASCGFSPGGLVEGIARVFPLPSSSLVEVVLNGLVGNGTLEGNHIKVKSDVGPVLANPLNDFRIGTSDPAFAQVQGYYWIDQALGWFSNKIQFRLSRPLSLTVHLGGISRTNAMFYYDGNVKFGEGDGIAYKDIIKDPTIVMHEVGHAALDEVANLPTDGAGGSIGEGSSDFLSANILDNPKMASFAYVLAPFKRNIENRAIAFKDFNGGLYNDSLAVSGTYWQLRNQLGPELTAVLVLSTAAKLGENPRFEDFGPALRESIGEFVSESLRAVALQTVALRGWQ